MRLTSSKFVKKPVFSKWDKISKNAMATMATVAAIDRLVHHAAILEVEGESVRTKVAKFRADRVAPGTG